MNNESMVYLNKVFSNIKIKSCPLMSSLTTDPESFDQQLTFFDAEENRGCGCGCGCNCGCDCGSFSCSDLDGELNFVIDSTEVIVSDFDLANPAGIQPCNVTVDGIPVDSLDFFNERYMAATNDLMAGIGDCACMERDLSTKGYFLIAGIGGWRAKLTIVLRGSVFSCGGCKKFKLMMSTKNNVFVNIPGLTTFSVADLCLPCTTGGIAPVINFSFEAEANLLNPTITANPCGGTCQLAVTGCLVAEPIAEVQVTRQTLFTTNARTVNVPCDDIAKCRQNKGVCGQADDDRNALQLRNRCCDDGRGREDDNPCEQDDDNDGDNGCGCGDRRCSCQREESSPRSITCQFNGRNGCSF